MNTLIKELTCEVPELCSSKENSRRKYSCKEISY